MFTTVLTKCISTLALAASLAAAAILAATAFGGPAAASTDLRPICNGVFFNMPARVGDTVTISIRALAADPDLTPVRLVSAANFGAQIGTVRIAGDHELEFTLTSSTPGTVYIYWAVSDGSLNSFQCSATGSNEEPPDNG